mmetsp:Transcript_23359/g.28593  ORF Transcript_23359/g.28593 Transcript_23359/m.28593 type:complete len:166 (+) Transcript_23359:126-623(+)
MGIAGQTKNILTPYIVHALIFTINQDAVQDQDDTTFLVAAACAMQRGEECLDIVLTSVTFTSADRVTGSAAPSKVKKFFVGHSISCCCLLRKRFVSRWMDFSEAPWCFLLIRLQKRVHLYCRGGAIVPFWTSKVFFILCRQLYKNRRKNFEGTSTINIQFKNLFY